MPKPMVVDIYHGDVVIDLKATAAAGIVGIIHKATEGTSRTDHSYADRRRQAREAGLLWGAYHFANDQDVAAQVENFLSFAEPDDNTLLALDYEPNGNHTMALDQAREFLRLIEQKTERKAVLYSGNLIKEELRAADDYLNSHRLWLAEYGPRPVLPVGWRSYWLWQYTGDGIGPEPHTIAGISGKIDLNDYSGPPEQLAAEWAGRPVLIVAEPAAPPPDAPAPEPIAWTAPTTGTAPVSRAGPQQPKDEVGGFFALLRRWFG